VESVLRSSGGSTTRTRGSRKEALAPVLIEALDDPDASVRARAWKRVRDLALSDQELGLFDPAATGEEHLVPVRRAATWWWRHAHPRDGTDPLAPAKLLASEIAAERWRAAKKLVELAAPCYRSLATEAFLTTFSRALASEKEEFVLRQELATFAAITGKPCAIKESATPEERANALKVALERR
jgi:hypothetical protein